MGLQKEHVEVEFHAEEQEAEAQVAQCNRQLENMREARKFLGRHRISMETIKDMMITDIEDEKRMTSQLEEAGERHMLEWSEQQHEIRGELEEALAAHRSERKQWEDDVHGELESLKAVRRDLDTEEAQLEEHLQRAHAELSKEATELSLECEEKSAELKELDSQIEEAQAKCQRFEEDWPVIQQHVSQSSMDKQTQQLEKDALQEEIARLKQECIDSKERTARLKKEESEQSAAHRREIHPSEDVSLAHLNDLKKKSQEYDDKIQEESDRRYDLIKDLEDLQNRKGLFSCLFPPAKSARPQG